MNIKEASKITGVPATTIRYYERESIVPNITRNDANVREFDEHAIRRIEFAKKMRDAGMEIKTLKKYIHLFDDVEHSEESQLALLKKQKDSMQIRRDKIQKAIDHLNYKIDNFYNHVLKTENELKKK